ncbi:MULTISPECIES: FxLYD domain-containing protein [Streptomyces]|uniref:FxLYD domain-containing protein n=1 Tax=Streptomyces fimbriatus TaxID=68197 RepID=A0ABW0D5X1_STRFI
MTGRRRGRGTAAATALAVALPVLGVAGCTDEEPEPAEPPASSLASRATEVWESATAEAGRRFEDLVRGFDAEEDVGLGSPSVAPDGRGTVEVTVRNTDDSTRTFLVQVDFTDPDGGLLDVVLVTVDDVPPGESAKATARSTHDLPGDARPAVERAVRY